MRFERALGLGHKIFAACEAQFRPARRPGQRERRKGVADEAEEGEGTKRDREVDSGQRAKVVGGGALPEWAHVLRVHRAAQPGGRGDQQRTHAAKARGLVPIVQRIAAGFPGTAGIAGVLAGTAGPVAAQAEETLAGVPVEQAPPETKKITKPSNHPDMLSCRRSPRQAKVIADPARCRAAARIRRPARRNMRRAPCPSPGTCGGPTHPCSGRSRGPADRRRRSG